MKKVSLISVILVLVAVLIAGCAKSQPAPVPAPAPAPAPSLPDNVVLSIKASSAPVLDGDRVEIGESDNLCVLTNEEWTVLKQKVLDGEL